MSHKSARDGEDHWVHPLKEENQRPCSECGGEMGYIGDLEKPSGATPTTPSRIATLECIECGHRVNNVTLGGF